MEGYIIESEDGKFLAQGLWWFPHDNLEDCFVFYPKILQIVNKPLTSDSGKLIFSEWKPKAKFAYPARYTLEEGVTVTGEKFLIGE